MKLLYVSKEIYNNKYKSLYKSYGVETLHYKNPLKATDNLQEIKPHILYIRKNEFPRLWKIVLTSLRERYSDNESIFILEGNLDDDELKAFNYLKGNIHIENAEKEIDTIKKSIVTIAGDESITNTYFPMSGEIGIGFVKPEDFSFISGNIDQLGENQLIFTPENSSDIEGIELETVISEVSVNRGDDVINLDIKIIKLTDSVVCQIVGDTKPYLSLIKTLFV